VKEDSQSRDHHELMTIGVIRRMVLLAGTWSEGRLTFRKHILLRLYGAATHRMRVSVYPASCEAVVREWLKVISSVRRMQRGMSDG
jgi:hypothetical protein